jgi:hypothetical protein
MKRRTYSTAHELARIASLSLVAIALLGCSKAMSSSGTALGTIAIDGSSPKAVSTMYGQNYWCWNGYGNNIVQAQPFVAPLRLDILRAGGYANDTEKSTKTYGTDPFDHAQIDRYVAYCKSVGAEPLIQVPLISNYAKHKFPASANAADAAEMVTYANVTKRYGIKYWEIGNEPDLYAEVNFGARIFPSYSVSRFCRDFNAFAKAMKAVDPTIKILGPELAWKYYPNEPKESANDWLTPFLRECKGNYDIVSVHRYSYPPDQCTLANVMNDPQRFVETIKSINELVRSLSPGIPVAVTEANITWDGTPKKNVCQASPQTFYAALWVAETLCDAREQGLWAMCYWSLAEGWTLGFIEPYSWKPRPEYYGFQLVSNNLGATSYAVSAPSGVSAYAGRSRDNDATAVIVLNKTAIDCVDRLTFVNVKGNPKGNFSVSFPAYSVSAVIFPDGGKAPTVYRYTAAEAKVFLPPKKARR